MLVFLKVHYQVLWSVYHPLVCDKFTLREKSQKSKKEERGANVHAALFSQQNIIVSNPLDAATNQFDKIKNYWSLMSCFCNRVFHINESVKHLACHKERTASATPVALSHSIKQRPGAHTGAECVLIGALIRKKAAGGSLWKKEKGQLERDGSRGVRNKIREAG